MFEVCAYLLKCSKSAKNTIWPIKPIMVSAVNIFLAKF